MMACLKWYLDPLSPLQLKKNNNKTKPPPSKTLTFSEMDPSDKNVLGPRMIDKYGFK